MLLGKHVLERFWLPPEPRWMRPIHVGYRRQLNRSLRCCDEHQRMDYRVAAVQEAQSFVLCLM